eukprot:scaffold23603_cov77-Isochrysis_galbana.AAC.1
MNVSAGRVARSRGGVPRVCVCRAWAMARGMEELTTARWSKQPGGVGAEASGPEESGVGGAHRGGGGGGRWRRGVEVEVGEVEAVLAVQGGDVAGRGDEATRAFSRFDAEMLEEYRLGEDVLAAGGGVQEGEAVRLGVEGEARRGGGFGDVGQTPGNAADDAVGGGVVAESGGGGVGEDVGV